MPEGSHFSFSHVFYEMVNFTVGSTLFGEKYIEDARIVRAFIFKGLDLQ